MKKIANKKDLKEKDLLKIQLDDKLVLLVNVNDQIYAIDAICSGCGGLLEHGKLDGYDLRCPAYNAVYDVRTGKVSPKTGWSYDLQSYSIIIDEKTGNILIDETI